MKTLKELQNHRRASINTQIEELIEVIENALIEEGEIELSHVRDVTIPVVGHFSDLGCDIAHNGTIVKILLPK